MKKFIVSLMMVMVLFASSVQAAPRRGGHHFSPAPAPHHHQVHHAPAHKVKHKHGEPIVSFFAGLVGSIIGNYMIGDYTTPRSSETTHCFTMISRSSGRQVKKCVNTTNWSQYNQSQIYETLYID